MTQIEGLPGLGSLRSILDGLHESTTGAQGRGHSVSLATTKETNQWNTLSMNGHSYTLLMWLSFVLWYWVKSEVRS
jgi:hypothetical protein